MFKSVFLNAVTVTTVSCTRYCRHGNKQEVRKTGSEMRFVPIKRFELCTVHKCVSIYMAASFECENSLNTASTLFMIHFGMLVRWTLGTSFDGVMLDNQNISLLKYSLKYKKQLYKIIFQKYYQWSECFESQECK